MSCKSPKWLRIFHKHPPHNLNANNASGSGKTWESRAPAAAEKGGRDYKGTHHREEVLPDITRVGFLGAVRWGAAKMSFGGSSLGSSGSRTSRMTFEYGRTHVVKPKGRHLATIVWLHGLGDNGSSIVVWSQLLETLPLPNDFLVLLVRFDVGDLSEDGPDDVEGLDASAAHVANLLSTEPADIKVGVGGFSMGAATALYSATCCAHGKYGNSNPYPLNLSAVVGLSGWLPCSRSLKNKIEASEEAARHAGSLPLLLCHGKGDDVVLYKHGEKSANALQSTGFKNLTFKAYSGYVAHCLFPLENHEAMCLTSFTISDFYMWSCDDFFLRCLLAEACIDNHSINYHIMPNLVSSFWVLKPRWLGHYTIPEEMDEVCKWFTAKLGLDGSSA
ncbi:hypothetical protein ACLOJK_021307 [Asimina triloba]